MATISLSGRIGSDLTVQSGANDSKRVSFSFAVPNGPRDGDIDPTWINVTCFNGRNDTFAENVAASFKKGDYVTVVGSFENYDKAATVNGEEKSIQMLSYRAFDVLSGTRYAVLDIKRSERQSGGDESPAPAKKAAGKPKPSNDDF